MSFFVYFRWGCKHEDTARKSYEKLQLQRSHKDLTIESAGFKISAQYPFVGATSDGYVNCTCCGSGIIEIKCPYNAKDMNVNDAAGNIDNFCISKDNNEKMELKRDHMYYYQVQMQLFVTSKKYCDFIVWTEKSADRPYVERIVPDPVFVQEALAKAEIFFKKCIIPELLSKVYTVPKPVPSLNDGQKYCYCNTPESGHMLECTSGFCATKLFHKECMKVKRVVKKWICPSCRKVINKQKRDKRKS